MAAMLAKDAKKANDARKEAILPELLPTYIKVPRKGPAEKASELNELNLDKANPDPTGLRNLSVQLLYSEPNSTLQGEWWEVQSKPCTKDGPYPYLPYPDVCRYLTVVVFADKVFPQALSTVSSYGIVGLYTTFVLLVSRFLRGFIANTSTRIMFDDMPNVDRVLQLCMDIYLVRESKELALEEDLFAKLVFLYRSPETLIKWTRMVPQQSSPPQNRGGERPPRAEREPHQPQGEARLRRPLPTQQQ